MKSKPSSWVPWVVLGIAAMSSTFVYVFNLVKLSYFCDFAKIYEHFYENDCLAFLKGNESFLWSKALKLE